ncbi:MAG: hypothetical protein LUC37_02775 [Prevotella sp.]|nr:hypothetical protein [Prevotella sp.]
MIETVETLTRHYVIDETTGEKRLTSTESHERETRRYQLVVRRFCGLPELSQEDGKPTAIVKIFKSDKECIDWINSLQFKSKEWIRKSTLAYRTAQTSATLDNFSYKFFAIEISEPQLSEYAKYYDGGIDECIILMVNKEPYYD